MWSDEGNFFVIMATSLHLRVEYPWSAAEWKYSTLLHAPPFGSWSKPALETPDLMPLLHTLQGIPSWVHRCARRKRAARKMKNCRHRSGQPLTFSLKLHPTLCDVVPIGARHVQSPAKLLPPERRWKKVKILLSFLAPRRNILIGRLSACISPVITIKTGFYAGSGRGFVEAGKNIYQIHPVVKVQTARKGGANCNTAMPPLVAWSGME